LWPLAHIQGRPWGAAGHIRPTTTSSRYCREERLAEVRLRISGSVIIRPDDEALPHVLAERELRES
jgi:hypothetical protein